MMRDIFNSQVAADARMLEPITTTIYQLAERWSLTPQQIIEAAIAGQISLYFRLGNCVIADLPNPTPGDFRRRSYQGYLRADKTTLDSILNDGEARHVQEAYLPDGKRVYVELPPQEVAPAVGEHAMRIQMATPLTIKAENLHALMEEVAAHEKTPLAPANQGNREVPAPANSASSAPAVPFTKAALISAHAHEWPTLKRDIADAAQNGLATAAKAGARGWSETEALNWARARGKLISAAKPADSVDQAMRNMSKLPSKKHTFQG
ncbi:MAG: hypothetical protein A2503_01260 [Burkholderiales bacterium RIFOXYD12_FULL_59_19]|nr:MAG: hypothetical protein A2503_01260 [Burkholderiales bacterium RIFOXYD12_FULL_59_19]